MDFNGIRKQAEILKKFHLMNQDREIISSHKNCNVSAHMYSGKISFDPTLLNRFTDDTILWLLLHEEGHFIYNQESKKRQEVVIKIWFIAMIISVISLGYLFFVWLKNIQYFEVALIIDFIVITSLLFYVGRNCFPEPYYNDEYHSDENAVKGLFIIRPDLVSWQIMYSSFSAFRECGKNTKRSYLRKFYLRIITKPHPPNILRVQKMRALFNKYKQNKNPNFNP
jgi:hypothetical protein